ncbi:hypothetical protein [Natrialba taiwanensis]|uniref:hypothetical protein n=1 Tax=Natrialba taiwanensis TaxID=160846 RepID=UPI001267AE16|nr:hypothetical protein [Natrialba taiwanensis]
MTLSNNKTTEVIGLIRFGIASILAPSFFVIGGGLIWSGKELLGVGAVIISLLMGVGCYRLYQAYKRPDVVQDERAKQYRVQASYNAFLTMILLPPFIVSAPSIILDWVYQRVDPSTEFGLVILLVPGLIVYLCSWMYYRTYGL